MRLILCNVLLALSACSTPPHEAKVTTFNDAEIRQAERALEAALSSSNPLAWVEHYTDDAVFVAPGAPAVQGREALTRMAQAIKRLHAGPRFLLDFNMFRLTEYYLGLCSERAIKIPDGYLDRMPAIQLIEQAMNVKPLATVPCNNDLLAENYIDDGRQLWLIDYEYSGNNDPTFELGNTCQEMQFSDEQIAEVCAAYFGEAKSNMIARMKLNMIMSDVGWGLWAAIQAKISSIDFDFWGWALERWSRAVQKMDSKEFEGWLKVVQS